MNPSPAPMPLEVPTVDPEWTHGRYWITPPDLNLPQLPGPLPPKDEPRPLQA